MERGVCGGVWVVGVIFESLLKARKLCILSKLFIFDSLFNRSLVRKLEKVDPRKMKREEKLAFWINIHNALVMHVWIHSISYHVIFQRNVKLVMKTSKRTVS